MEFKPIADSIEQSELIALINALAKKKKETGLTKQETEIKKQAYDIYLKRMKEQFSAKLDSIDVQQPNGESVPFKTYMKDIKKQNPKNSGKR